MHGRSSAGGDWRTVALGLCAIAVFAGGLSSCVNDSSSAPVVMCQHTLIKRGAGSGDSVNDATRQGTVPIDGTSRSGIVLLLTNDCSRGATLQISPAGSLSIAAKALARDGKLAGVLLVRTPRTAMFE